MIRLAHHDAQHLAVHVPYEQREQIRAVAEYPDLRWYPAGKHWLIDARLFDKLSAALGHDFAPLPVDFFDALPPVEWALRTQGRLTKGRRK